MGYGWLFMVDLNKTDLFFIAFTTFPCVSKHTEVLHLAQNDSFFKCVVIAANFDMLRK